MHGPQVSRAGQALGRQVRLADDRERAGQGGVEGRLVGGVLEVDHGVVAVEPLERRRREDPVDALRRRPQDHDGSRVGVRHGRKIPGGHPPDGY